MTDLDQKYIDNPRLKRPDETQDESWARQQAALKEVMSKNAKRWYAHRRKRGN